MAGWVDEGMDGWMDGEMAGVWMHECTCVRSLQTCMCISVRTHTIAL